MGIKIKRPIVKIQLKSISLKIRNQNINNEFSKGYKFFLAILTKRITFEQSSEELECVEPSC